MPAYPVTVRAAPSPLKAAARVANVWGWSYIVTILGAIGAGYVDPGPLRVLLLNLGILCCAIGVLELVWRHQLLKTGEARWAKMLALNQVGGTLALCWSLYLLYEVPDKILDDYSKKSELWNRAFPLIKSMDTTHLLTDDYILHVWHFTKLLGVFGIGVLLLLSQVWVIYRYLRFAREISQTPPTPLNIPPVLK
jgi:hypothetical protein